MQPQRSLARIAEVGAPTGCAQEGGCHCHTCSVMKTINTKVLIRAPGFHLRLRGSSFCLLLTSNRLGMEGSGAQSQPVSSRYGGWLLHAGNCCEVMCCSAQFTHACLSQSCRAAQQSLLHALGHGLLSDACYKQRSPGLMPQIAFQYVSTEIWRWFMVASNGHCMDVLFTSLLGAV